MRLLVNEHKIKDAHVAVLLFFASFLFLIPSYVAPWGNQNPSYDMLVYMQCGQWLNEGMVMYKDMFDHKGPLVYWYDAFALHALGEIGLWVFDMVLIYIATVFTYKTFRLYLSKVHSLFLSLLIILFMNGPFAIGTNGPETLPMVATTIACFIFLKNHKRNKHLDFRDSIALAMCFAVCISCKPNTAATICIIELYFIVSLFTNINPKERLGYISGSLLGLIIVLTPMIMYMIHTDSIKHCFDAYILFNTNNYAASVTISERLQIFAKISVSGLVAYVLYTFFMIQNFKTNKTFAIWISIIFLFSCWMNLWALGFGFRHYAIPIVPVITMLCSISWDKLIHNKWLGTILLIYVVLYAIANIDYRLSDTLKPFDSTRYDNIAQYISTNTKTEDRIAIYNDDHGIWRHTDRKTATRYFFTLGQGSQQYVDDEAINEIKKAKPKLIFCPKSANAIFLNEEYVVCDDAPVNTLKRK